MALRLRRMRLFSSSVSTVSTRTSKASLIALARDLVVVPLPVSLRISTIGPGLVPLTNLPVSLSFR